VKKVIAIVQARMGSTRLPGKVMCDLIGKPMIVHEIERVLRSECIGSVVIATTQLPADDVIVQLCKDRAWNYYRGDEQDVLDRYYHAAKKFGADVIVRLTADCPLIEPSVIDLVIKQFCLNYPHIDYASNVFPQRTFPLGLDTEIMTMEALEKSWKYETNSALREHVTQHIVKNPENFHISGITNKQDFSGLRWTVDTKEDFLFVREVYSFFGHNQFSWTDVLDLIKAKPELSLINKNSRQKEV
jgi:spore coat polysaccharide biosynthesis protein SpsF